MSQWWHAVQNWVRTFMLFGNLLCGTTDCPLAPGLAVQLCLLHPRQYISLCISQNASCFGISGCSCTAVNRMYGHGSLTCDWPQCACQCMGQFPASAPRNLCRRGTPPHSGGCTRVPAVLPGPGRDRDAPWGLGGDTTPPTPTQRRIHPSPSGPAWAGEG